MLANDIREKAAEADRMDDGESDRPVAGRSGWAGRGSRSISRLLDRQAVHGDAARVAQLLVSSAMHARCMRIDERQQRRRTGGLGGTVGTDGAAIGETGSTGAKENKGEKQNDACTTHTRSLDEDDRRHARKIGRQ